MTWSEKRSAPRYKVRFPVRYWNESLELRGHTVDVSASGVRIVGDGEGLCVGHQVHLEFRLPDGLFYAEGKVRRTAGHDAHEYGEGGEQTMLGLTLLSLFDCIPGTRVTRGKA